MEGAHEPAEQSSLHPPIGVHSARRRPENKSEAAEREDMTLAQIELAYWQLLGRSV